MQKLVDEMHSRHSLLSKHAQKRRQQRSIPPSVIDLLLNYGDERHLGSGTTSRSFSKKGWKHVAAYLGTQAKYFEQYRACYVVVADDGKIVTAAYIH